MIEREDGSQQRSGCGKVSGEEGKSNRVWELKQVRMRAYNKGCVTSLVSLPRFCVTNCQVIKTKLRGYLINCGVPPPAKIRITEPEQNKIFFPEKWLRCSLAPPAYVLPLHFNFLQYYVWVCCIFAGFLWSNFVRSNQQTEAENNDVEVVSQFELQQSPRLRRAMTLY